MEISFLTKEIRDICESHELAQELLGHQVSKVLQTVLSEIDAADSINEILNGDPTKIDFNGENAISIKLSKDDILIFVNNNIKFKKPNFKVFDWEKVTRVKIVKLGKLE